MSEDQNVKMHKKGQKAFNENDMDTLSEMMAEDTTWHVPGRNPMAGDHEGRSTVLQQFGKMAELADGDLKIEQQEFLASDTKTTAVFRLTATRNGKRLDAQMCEVVEWRDGKVAEEWVFVKDLYAFDDFWS